MLHSLNTEENLLPLESLIRDRMEEIISQPFDDICDGSESVTINGKSHSITWTVTQPDMEGDPKPASIAKEVKVTIGNKSLTTLAINSQGVMGKI